MIMKSQRLTEIRKQVWDDKFLLLQPDPVLQEQLDRFAELIIEACLETFTTAEKWAIKLDQKERAETIQELSEKFKEKFEIVPK